MKYYCRLKSIDVDNECTLMTNIIFNEISRNINTYNYVLFLYPRDYACGVTLNFFRYISLTCKGYRYKMIFVSLPNHFWSVWCRVPLILINLELSLTDVRWSPFSSTVFCVITEKCRAIFYDLDVSRKIPVCDQLIQSSTSAHRLVRLVFDRRVPVILIGSFQ